ncbi:MAG: tail fiber domain-containing protein, partial [Bacteroidetes bacterium]|nr:tail fiber domain-containing protein [Bacteroidota bacterium]
MLKHYACIAALSAFCAIASQAQVGIGTTSPNSTLDVRGSLSVNLRSFTANTTALSTDNSLIFTGTSAATVTLPDATTCAGRSYWIKNSSTAATTPVLTVATTASQTIDGNASWTLDEPYEVVKVTSNGTNWWVVNQDVPAPKTGTSGGPWLQGGNKVSATKTIGTTSNFDFPFITNNTERMRLSTSGFLGLGTNAPAGHLQVVSQGSEVADDYLFDDYGTGTQGIYLSKSRGSFASPSDLQANDQIGWLRFVPRFAGTLGYAPGTSVEAYYRGNGTTNYTDMRIFTSNAERVRIDTNGCVAIGAQAFTAAAPEKLLVDAGTTTSYNVISGKGTINNYLQLNIQNRSGGTSASSDVVATANNGNETTNFVDMGINSGGYATSNILGGANTAYLYSTGRDFVIGNGSSSRNLIFFTNGTNTTDEKMRILSGGNVGIGTTTPADKLSVAGVVAPSADNTYTLGRSGARWSAVWSANGTVQTSDARLKTNILPLNYGLKEVMQLNPVRYNWKDNPEGDSKIGLVAQEVKEIVPEV